MDDLPAFLSARYGELERNARDGEDDCLCGLGHSRKRTLNRLRGLRKILEDHKPGKTVGWGKRQTISCEGCGFGGPCDDPWTEDINKCPVLCALALEFLDHPDYLEEFKPS